MKTVSENRLQSSLLKSQANEHHKNSRIFTFYVDSDSSFYYSLAKRKRFDQSCVDVLAKRHEKFFLLVQFAIILNILKHFNSRKMREAAAIIVIILISISSSSANQQQNSDVSGGYRCKLTL